MNTERQEEFERYRRFLEGLAYRFCGVWADAQDIVEEANIRWLREDPGSIKNARAWLVTVCSRLAIDLLKSSRVRREEYFGVWLPEPFVDSSGESPDAKAEIEDSISMALMLAMERLNPMERAAFLLHDVFGYGFEEVALILGNSIVASRKAAYRARLALRQDRPRFDRDAKAHRRLLSAFLEALNRGETNAIKALLAESVALYSDGGGKVKTADGVLLGRETVAAFFETVWKGNQPASERIQIVDQIFNGQPGVLVYRDGHLIVALCVNVVNDTIQDFYAVRNPDKLSVFV